MNGRRDPADRRSATVARQARDRRRLRRTERPDGPGRRHRSGGRRRAAGPRRPAPGWRAWAATGLASTDGSPTAPATPPASGRSSGGAAGAEGRADERDRDGQGQPRRGQPRRADRPRPARRVAVGERASADAVAGTPRSAGPGSGDGRARAVGQHDGARRMCITSDRAGASTRRRSNEGRAPGGGDSRAPRSSVPAVSGVATRRRSPTPWPWRGASPASGRRTSRRGSRATPRRALRGASSEAASRKSALQDLAVDEDGLDVRDVGRADDRADRVDDRRDVHRRPVDDDDVGLLARRDRARPVGDARRPWRRRASPTRGPGAR